MAMKKPSRRRVNTVVLISAMQAVGYTKNTFGEVTGPLPDLFG